MFIIHEIFLHRSGQSVHEQPTFFCVRYSLFTIPWCEFTSKQICPFFSSFILNYILHENQSVRKGNVTGYSLIPSFSWDILVT